MQKKDDDAFDSSDALEFLNETQSALSLDSAGMMQFLAEFFTVYPRSLTDLTEYVAVQLNGE